MKNNLKKFSIPLLLLFILTAFFVVGCSNNQESSGEVPEPTSELVEGETTAISVYYPTGKILVEERHTVPISENLPQVALEEIFKAEPEEYKIPVVIPDARVKSVEVDKESGLCTVNFSKEILNFPEENDSKKAKVAAFAAITETLKQFSEIKSLKILVEGKEKGTVGGKDIQEFWGEVSLIKQPINILRNDNKGNSSGKEDKQDSGE